MYQMFTEIFTWRFNFKDQISIFWWHVSKGNMIQWFIPLNGCNINRYFNQMFCVKISSKLAKNECMKMGSKFGRLAWSWQNFKFAKFNPRENVDHPQFAKYSTREIKVFYSISRTTVPILGFFIMFMLVWMHICMLN